MGGAAASPFFVLSIGLIEPDNESSFCEGRFIAMTRVRFVKLLMGQGVRRNDASALATHYRSIGIPYLLAFIDYFLDLQSESKEECADTVTYIYQTVEQVSGKKCNTFWELVSKMLKYKEAIYEFCN